MTRSLIESDVRGMKLYLLDVAAAAANERAVVGASYTTEKK